jgi:hypothetical protein
MTGSFSAAADASSSAMRESDELRRMLCSKTGTPGSFSLAKVATKSTAGDRVRTELEEGAREG